MNLCLTVTGPGHLGSGSQPNFKLVNSGQKEVCLEPEKLVHNEHLIKVNK